MTWSPGVTLAPPGGTTRWWIDAAAAGRKAFVGYAVPDGSGSYAVYRRTTDFGLHWGAPVALSPDTAPPAGPPVLSYRGGTWRATFERCVTTECSETAVYYRESADGGSNWSPPERISDSNVVAAIPGGASFAGKTLVVYTGFDSSGIPWAYVRSGS